MNSEGVSHISGVIQQVATRSAARSMSTAVLDQTNMTEPQAFRRGGGGREMNGCNLYGGAVDQLGTQPFVIHEWLEHKNGRDSDAGERRAGQQII